MQTMQTHANQVNTQNSNSAADILYMNIEENIKTDLCKNNIVIKEESVKNKPDAEIKKEVEICGEKKIITGDLIRFGSFEVVFVIE